MHKLTLSLSLAFLLVVPAFAQVSSPPEPLELLAPKDGFVRKLSGEITFRVQGQPNETAGSLGIELKTADANEAQPNVDEGRYDEDDPYYAGKHTLVETEPGSGIYEVTVDFQEQSDAGYYWHAFRELTQGQNCTPKTGGSYDCFQETAERTFEVRQPEEHGAREPKNNTPAGAARNRGLTTDGWLESRTDRDWYHFTSPKKGTKLDVLIGNYWSGKVPAGEQAGIVFAVYRAGRMGRPVVKKRLDAREQDRTLKATIRPGTKYFLVVRHAKEAGKTPAENVEYSFYIDKGAS